MYPLADTVQKGIAIDPKAPPPSAGQNAETATLVASLREVIQTQATEIETLRKQLKELSTASQEVRLFCSHTE
jgi:intracellular protein transport protein USO1